MMFANLEDILSDIDLLCKDLINFATTSESGSGAFEMEALVFQRVLEIGRLVMAGYLSAQSANYRWRTAKHPNGHDLAYSDERRGIYYSIFGEIVFHRSYYRGNGHGVFPMDGALNLAPKGSSDFVRKMVEQLAVNASFAFAAKFLAEYFPVAISTRAVQEAVGSDSQDAEAYYEQAPAPPSCTQATILVVEADGKGIPMVKVPLAEESEPGKPAVEQSASCKGAKGPPKREGKKKDATVVSVSTHVPFVRTPEEVLDSLFKVNDRGKTKEMAKKEASYSHGRIEDGAPDVHVREAPTCKRVWATLEGKEPALLQARVWVDQVNSSHIQDRIALTDGLEALQRRTAEMFPDHQLILDIMHAMTYLWNAAEARFGKDRNATRDCIRHSLLRMLRGEAPKVVDELNRWAKQAVNSVKRETINKSANYLNRNLERMKYDEYLAKGWPIATGIIEGACRHVVKDRCEGSGMRWTEEGAEAILHLRCVHQNGDWNQYHQFRMKARHERVYGVVNGAQTMLPEQNVFKLHTRNNIVKAA